MSNRKLWSPLAMMLVLVMCVTAFAGCNKLETPPAGPNETPAAGNQTEPPANSAGPAVTKDTPVVGLAKEPDLLDSQLTTSHYSRQVFSNIYDNLIDKDANGNYVPCLAETWSVSDDKLVYTFNLLKGVKFHNGEELKASDVAFTFTRGMEQSASKFFFACVSSAEAVDDYTVKITLKYPFAVFEELLTLPQMGILNQKAVTEGGEDYARNPVGTGAYKFAEWISGQAIKFAGFDEYWGTKANIANLEFRIVTDTGTGMIAMEKGEIDIFYDVASTDQRAADENPNLTFEAMPSTSYEQVVLNNENPILSDVNVRKALAYAIDKQSIITVATTGSGILADSQIAPFMPGYSENVTAYPYDAEKAKQCLAQSAYPNGFECTIKINSG